jgi:hypothetical protein
MGNHDSSRYERKKTYKLKERLKRPKRIRLAKDPAKVIRNEPLILEDTVDDAS